MDSASKNEDKMMDTEVGGETSQYESIKTQTVPFSKQRGQLGTGPNTSETAGPDEERGEKTADNIRYGQNISESGMGGKTTSGIGQAEQPSDDAAKDVREAQQYGKGSGVGA